MSFGLAQKVADAVLYEGYVLYPYRASSAKNRVRFQFGVVAPRDHGAAGGSEPWEMQTECLVEPGANPVIDLKIRCLQLQARGVEEAAGGAPGSAGAGERFRQVEFLDVGGELQIAWDEGVERELEVTGIALRDLLPGGAGERVVPFELGAGNEVEELRSPAGELCGRLVRRRWAIKAVVRLSAEKVHAVEEKDSAPAAGAAAEKDAADAGNGSAAAGSTGVVGASGAAGSLDTEEAAQAEILAGEGDWVRLRVRIENETPLPDDRAAEREEALRRSLVSAHTLLAVRDGSFVSLLDPPAAAAPAAAGCVNLHTWPVLIGAEGSREVVLSSPIILYDYPAIAPESPGDLCDSTEIDEILTLRVMTLTEEEKRQARGTDPRARQIIERADGIPPEIMERLHGAVRSLRAVASPADPETPELASWESFLNPAGEAPPEAASLTIGAATVGKGSRVRLRPSRRADSMDFFLAGREARVAAVFHDVDDAAYVAVTLADDPAGDLHAGGGRFFYFYPEEIEPLAAEGAPVPGPGGETP